MFHLQKILNEKEIAEEFYFFLTNCQKGERGDETSNFLISGCVESFLIRGGFKRQKIRKVLFNLISKELVHCYSQKENDLAYFLQELKKQSYKNKDGIAECIFFIEEVVLLKKYYYSFKTVVEDIIFKRKMSLESAKFIEMVLNNNTKMPVEFKMIENCYRRVLNDLGINLMFSLPEWSMVIQRFINSNENTSRELKTDFYFFSIGRYVELSKKETLYVDFSWEKENIKEFLNKTIAEKLKDSLNPNTLQEAEISSILELSPKYLGYNLSIVWIYSRFSSMSKLCYNINKEGNINEATPLVEIQYFDPLKCKKLQVGRLSFYDELFMKSFTTPNLEIYNEFEM